ncbi:hypothetical protein L218DRAFT_669564 [Marasmius fiardii PR-910]|nr:hypothetical protein L218DRAFT_669564 [Marasmius fiardii PR-910]
MSQLQILSEDQSQWMSELSSRGNAEYHKIFPDVPTQENLFASLPCGCFVHHREKFLSSHGTLYVSEKHVCYTDHSEYNISISIHEVISVQHRKSVHYKRDVNFLRIVMLDTDYQFIFSEDKWGVPGIAFDAICNMWRVWIHGTIGFERGMSSEGRWWAR